MHPFDSRAAIAGHGTLALELLEQVPDVSAVLVPVSGGGPLSGVAAAVKALRPQVAVIGVEPELAGDDAESLRRGERAVWTTADTFRTCADGLRATTLGTLPWAHDGGSWTTSSPSRRTTQPRPCVVWPAREDSSSSRRELWPRRLFCAAAMCRPPRRARSWRSSPEGTRTPPWSPPC